MYHWAVYVAVDLPGNGCSHHDSVQPTLETNWLLVLLPYQMLASAHLAGFVWREAHANAEPEYFGWEVWVKNWSRDFSIWAVSSMCLGRPDWHNENRLILPTIIIPESNFPVSGNLAISHRVSASCLFTSNLNSHSSKIALASLSTWRYSNKGVRHFSKLELAKTLVTHISACFCAVNALLHHRTGLLRSVGLTNVRQGKKKEPPLLLTTEGQWLEPTTATLDKSLGLFCL